jgi:alkylation response protein AidB-like acyl-CoA dehydrogenase
VDSVGVTSYFKESPARKGDHLVSLTILETFCTSGHFVSAQLSLFMSWYPLIDFYQAGEVLEEIEEKETTGWQMADEYTTNRGTSPHRRRVLKSLEFLTRILAAKMFIRLTISEAHAGGDVFGMKTTAVKSEDGKFWIINGEKKWITNGQYVPILPRTPKRDNDTDTV